MSRVAWPGPWVIVTVEGSLRRFRGPGGDWTGLSGARVYGSLPEALADNLGEHEVQPVTLAAA